MKPGDMVRFTRSHCGRSGYEYCADWVGLILSPYPQLTISWMYPPSHMFTAHYGESNVHTTLEIISEGG